MVIKLVGRPLPALWVFSFFLVYIYGQIPPSRAYKYRSILRLELTKQWPTRLQDIALFGSQIQQESGWNPLAQSKYAGGLSQFTPDTADWIATLDAELQASKDVFNPNWAIRAQIFYDKFLWEKFPAAKTDDDRDAFMLASYNGGLGWILKERKLATNPGRWFCDNGVEKKCIRVSWACKENRAYPRKILYHWKPKYEEANF